MISNRLGQVWDFLGSRNFSVFIFILGTTQVLILLAFAFLIPTWWINDISILLPFKIFYLLFFLNLVLCEVKWLPTVIRQIKREELSLNSRIEERFRYRIKLGDARPAVGFLRKLKKQGYSIYKNSDPGILFYALRGQFSPLGNLVLHTSFLFLLFGAVVNLFFRFEGNAIVPEGYTFQSQVRNYKSTAIAPLATVPRLAFNLKRITATFWEDKMFFTGLVAHIRHSVGDDQVKLSRAVNIDNTSLTLAGYGYAPKYILKNSSNRVLDQRNVFLNIFVPEVEDFFRIPGYPYKIYISFIPHYQMKENKVRNLSMNPVNPAFGLRVLRGRLTVYEGIIKQGEWAEFDGFSISFPSFVKWGNFIIISEPGRPLLWIGFVLLISGMLMKLIFYRKELLVYQDDDGTFVLAGKFDHYQKLNQAWLQELSFSLKGDKS